MDQGKLTRVLKSMEEHEIPQMIISDPVAIFYLTGKWIFPGERLLALYLNVNGNHKMVINKLFPQESDLGVDLIYYDDIEDGVEILSKYVDKDKTIYVGKNIDDKGALIPYIMIEKYKNYTDPLVLLNDVTTELNKAYGDVKILLNQLSGYVGDKLTYGSMFSYTSSGHLVIDNRYTFLVGNSMYLVTTKEENENSTEINNVCALIIKTLKEVNQYGFN